MGICDCMKAKLLLTTTAIALALTIVLSSMSSQIQNYDQTTTTSDPGNPSPLPTASVNGDSSVTRDAGTSSSLSNSVSPIRHIIIIMQENHAFDNFFGTFPNVPSAYALNPSICIPLRVSPSPTKLPCEKPFNAVAMPQIQSSDQCHTEECSVPDYNSGAMNGFVQFDTTRSMAYYDGSAIPQFWDLASYYNLDYDFFSSAISYSEANHLFAVSANTQYEPFIDENQSLHSFLNFTFPEIGTAMTEANVTWGYYQYNWNDSKYQRLCECACQQYPAPSELA
jgi:phospholipase C